jgi:hypothetical protein
MTSQSSLKHDVVLDTFAAELTLAAYRVVLQSGMPGRWVDLELGLWRELSNEVRTKGLVIGFDKSHAGLLTVNEVSPDVPHSALTGGRS